MNFKLKLDILFIFSIFVFSISCNSSIKDTNISEEVQKFHGQKFTFFDTLVYFDPDSVLVTRINRNQFFNKKFTVISYINANCGSCVERLKDWDSLSFILEDKYDFESIMIASTNNHHLFHALLYEGPGYNHTILFDENKKYQNKFPKEYSLRTFLLEDGFIKLVGDPIINTKVWDLYQEILN